jgi:hypothetical protein
MSMKLNLKERSMGGLIELEQLVLLLTLTVCNTYRNSTCRDGASTGADPGFLERGVQPLKKDTHGGGTGPASEHQRCKAPKVLIPRLS